MKTIVILNPRAGSSEDFRKIEAELASLQETAIWKTEAPGDAERMAGRAIDEGAEIVVAAGGDGTINAVVNGLSKDFSKSRLGVLPMGTGNDLCRTLGVPFDPDEALEALLDGTERHLDVIRVELEDETPRYAVNAVSGGFSGKVTEAVTEELKSRFGPFAFWIGASEAASDIPTYEATIRFDRDVTDQLEVFAIIVANGRTVAGGFEVAPGADPRDGLLDVILLRHGNALDLAALGARILAGDILDSELVTYRAATGLTLTTIPPMPFNVDGEPLPRTPRRVEVLPKALRVMCRR